MSKFVKEYVEVREFTTLDELIEQLVALRDRLPEAAEAEVKLRGDDVFGRHVCVSYKRQQSEAEADLDSRYADAYRQSRERELERLQQELGVVCRPPRGRRLRAVA